MEYLTDNDIAKEDKQENDSKSHEIEEQMRYLKTLTENHEAGEEKRNKRLNRSENIEEKS